ncbi:MAG: thioredoxin fold domain-containing protein [Planctomycetota bacterium]
MSDFEQNGLWGLQKFAEQQQTELQEQQEQKQQKQKKEGSHLPRVLLVVFGVIFAAGIVWLLGPSLKGSGLREKVEGLLGRGVSLTGITYSEDNPVAIVDGKIVHDGDAVGEVTVVKIHRDKVDFEKAGRRWSQSLPEAEQGVHSGFSGHPVLLVLGAEACAPCRKMKPILKELKSKYKRKFEVRYIDVWKDRAAGAKYGARAIPTQIFYDDKGREVFRHVGFYTKEEILTVWRQIGIEF